MLPHLKNRCSIHTRRCRAGIISCLCVLCLINSSIPGDHAFGVPEAHRAQWHSRRLLSSQHCGQVQNRNGIGITNSGAKLGLVGQKKTESGIPRANGSGVVKNTYMVGIAWYLMHFVIGIGNDGIMKFLGGSLSPFQIVFLRFSAAAAVLLPVMLFQGSSAFKTSRMWMHGARGALLAIGIGLWCLGLSIMPFASCVVINNTMPFFKMLFAKVLLGENVVKERWIASFMGFVGCLIVFNPTAATFQPRSFVLLLSAICFAMLDILNKKFAVEESTVAMLFYGSVATASLAFAGAWKYWVPLGAMQWGLFGVLGCGANLLLFCLLRAFRYVDASATCPYRYTEFVIAAIAGILIFHERPTLATLLGSCIIVPSVIYCAYKEVESQKEESAAA